MANDFDPTMWHQDSPPTRLGNKVIPELIEKAQPKRPRSSMLGPKPSRRPVSQPSAPSSSPEAPKTKIKPSGSTKSPTSETKPAVSKELTKQHLASTTLPKFTPSAEPNPHSNLANYHTQMAGVHHELHQKTNDADHEIAATAHTEAATHHDKLAKMSHASITPEHKFPAYDASHRAEKLSHAAEVPSELGSHMQAHGLPMKEGEKPPTPPKPVGSGARGGYPRYWRRTAAYGVQSPNLLGSFAGGYGMGLAAASPGGPMFQTAQLVQQGIGKLHSLAQARRWPINVAQPLPEDHTAIHQRQQMQQQLYDIAHKSLDGTPPVREGTRRLNK